MSAEKNFTFLMIIYVVDQIQTFVKFVALVYKARNAKVKHYLNQRENARMQERHGNVPWDSKAEATGRGP